MKLLPELTRCRDEQKGGVCNRDEEKDSLGLASKYKGYTGFLCVFNSYSVTKKILEQCSCRPLLYPGKGIDSVCNLTNYVCVHDTLGNIH